MVSDKGLGPLGMQKRIPTKTESSEASKVFIKRKKRVQYMWIDTEAGSERESGSVMCSWPFELFCGAFLLAFLWPIILVCGPYLVNLRTFPGVFTHLLAKVDSTGKVYG